MKNVIEKTEFKINESEEYVSNNNPNCPIRNILLKEVEGLIKYNKLEKDD